MFAACACFYSYQYSAVDMGRVYNAGSFTLRQYRSVLLLPAGKDRTAVLNVTGERDEEEQRSNGMPLNF